MKRIPFIVIAIYLVVAITNLTTFIDYLFSFNKAFVIAVALSSMVLLFDSKLIGEFV